MPFDRPGALPPLALPMMDAPKLDFDAFVPFTLIAIANRIGRSASRSYLAQFGIGLNGGRVIIGDIGYREHVVFTALGDAVNVAARLQDMTKELRCEVLIAEEVCRTAGMAADALSRREVPIRGRDKTMEVRVAERASQMAAVTV